MHKLIDCDFSVLPNHILFNFSTDTMSNYGYKENNENLLIDFNNLNISDDRFNKNINRNECDAAKNVPQDRSSTKHESQSMAFLCSSQPLYKLLERTGSAEIEDNNPFDHLDKQAGLLDDPFEIVENAALISSGSTLENEKHEVETGTLITFDSPNNGKPPLNDIHSSTLCDTPKSCSSSNDNKSKETFSQDSVQNTSQKQLINTNDTSQKPSASPTGRSKGKNTSISLLKYSLSNSRTDLANENLSPGDEHLYRNETQQKKSKMGMRRGSSTDDSFDDIWATIPNLIDSQTDMDIDSDIDNDIAKLNIPMLNVSTPGKNSEENGNSNADNERSEECLETKAFHRNEILEKFASIKQKIPQSPAISDTTTTIVPVHNETVDIKCDQSQSCFDDEPVTPKSQFSSVVLPQPPQPADNPNSLIENLMKMVNQCGDKSQQITAKHLLDDLSSILTKGGKYENKEIDPKNHIEKCQPVFSQLKRQGTFSIEKDDTDTTNVSYVSDINCSNGTHSPRVDNELSAVMQQIQNAFGSNQSINVLQSNDQYGELAGPSVKPTYIVVMAQSGMEYKEESTFQRPQRSRSQSLTLKEKPLAAIRAAQHKMEKSQVQSVAPSTPLKHPFLQRRSSFSSIVRKTQTVDTEVPAKIEKPSEKPNPPKVIRRRSLQGPSNKQPDPVATVQAKSSSQILRRRSFQETSTATGIRSPSPKSKFNRASSSTNTTGTLTRRKSFATDLTKESPHKMKSSYGIMKKPPAPTAARNLKIRVTQGASGRSSAPLRAVVPMKQVASLLLINETVSPLDDKRNSALITSTPRSIPILSPAKSTKGMKLYIN